MRKCNDPRSRDDRCDRPDPYAAPSAPASAMERQMDLDLDYARVRAALDMDAIMAEAASGADRMKAEAATVILPPDGWSIDDLPAGHRRRSRALQAACVAAVLLITTGLVAGAGWLVANRGDAHRFGAEGVPPLFPWLDRAGRDTPVADETTDRLFDDPLYTEAAKPDATEYCAEEVDSGISVVPTNPSEPMRPGEEPNDRDGESETGIEAVVETDAAADHETLNPSETAPFGSSVTVDHVTYYDTGYAIPLGILKDRLQELGAASDDRVCYTVVGLDAGRYIVATANGFCYLYKTPAAPDPALWLEAWLSQLPS